MLEELKIGRGSVYRTHAAVALGHIEGAVSRRQRLLIQNVRQRLRLKVEERRNLVDGQCRSECLKLRHIAYLSKCLQPLLRECDSAMAIE